MKTSSRNASWVIHLSLVLAFLLTIFPIPESWDYYRPSWVMLVLVYWSIALSHRVGLLWAFICGLLLDGLLGTTLGIHSFALCVILFITQLNHKKVRLYPMWKKALTVAGLSLLYLALELWLSRATGVPSQPWQFWMAVLTNALLCPWLFILLKDIRHYFRVA